MSQEATQIVLWSVFGFGMGIAIAYLVVNR